MMATAMAALDAIRARRTHKRYTARPVPRAEIEALLELAVLAPNHRMTEPWRFVVLGTQARRHFAELRAAFRTSGPKRDGEDDLAARRAKLVEDALAVPAYVIVLMHEDADELRRGEDHAAVWMGVQNMLLGATALGLGTKIGTGRLFEQPELRALVGARDDERVLGVIQVGEPAETRPMKPRTPATAKTTWLD